MIGVYDYTVLATYLSLAFGVSGILAAMNGSPYSALLCLMVSGLLDAFDGRIARTKKNRTEQEKRFGIQIDSLNDVVCFGVLPGVIGASLGGGEWWLRASVLFYILAALIRLAYFNVTEEERQSATNGAAGITTLASPSPPPPLSCRFSGRCRCASALRRPRSMPSASPSSPSFSSRRCASQSRASRASSA